MWWKEVPGLGVVVFVGLVVGVGCASKTAEQKVRAGAVVVADEGVEEKPVVAVVEKVEPVTVEALEGLLCGEGKTCKVIRTWDAGVDEDDEPVQVVTVTSDGKAAAKAEGDSFYYYKKGDAYCFPVQHWMVRPTLMKGGGADVQPFLLMDFCPESEAFDMYATNEVMVEAGRFTYHLGGGMGLQSSHAKTIGLPSLQLVRESYDEWHKLMVERENFVWEPLKLAGRSYGFVLDCEGQEDPYKGDDWEEPAEDNYAYQPIPVVSLPASYRAGGWRDTELGSCSSVVNSLAKGEDYTGFITHGQAGRAGDAGFRVIMASATEMYVEVTDDVWVEEASSVLKTDHLELWGTMGVQCPEATKGLFQWGIGLDGKVETFYGKPKKSPVVESVVVTGGDGSQKRRLKIVLPEKYRALTLVYSDSDDGERQGRLIATSQVKYRNPFTLGKTREIGASEGVCVIQNQVLEYVPEMRRPKSPIFSFPDHGEF